MEVHYRALFERAHAVARFGVRLPMPLFWLTSQVVCRALLPPLRARVRCPTIYGFDLVVRPTNGGTYYRCGFYEHGTMHVIAACLRPGDVFVDAGASVGQMSFLAARCVGPSGRVLAFEPAPERHEDLVAGIELNAFDQVLPFRAGLADADDEKLLYMRGSPSMADQTRTTDVVRVPVRRLDDVLAEQRISRVRFIKIDVEGLEPDVLLGARDLLAGEEPPIVCYEYGVYAHGRAVHDILGERYALYQLAGTAHRPSPLVEVDPRRLRHDNVFAIPRELVSSLPPRVFSGTEESGAT
jgi:FkbM family methyltransferase